MEVSRIEPVVEHQEHPAPEVREEMQEIEPSLSALPEFAIEPPGDEPTDQPQPIPPMLTPPPPTSWAVALPKRKQVELSAGPRETPVIAIEEEADASEASEAGALVEPSPIPGHNKAPTYPLIAHRRGLEGTVVVLLEISATGEVTAAHIVQSSGSSLLDDAALLQLSQWQFAPAMREGTAVASSYRKSVEFRLQ